MEEQEPNDKQASRKVQIDWDFVAMRLEGMATGVDIAKELGIHVSLLYKRYEEEHPGKIFSQFRAEKRARTRNDMRSVLINHAKNNPGAAIFWAKNYLGMTDQPKERPMPEQKIQIEIVHPNTKDAEDPSDRQL